MLSIYIKLLIEKEAWGRFSCFFYGLLVHYGFIRLADIECGNGRPMQLTGDPGIVLAWEQFGFCGDIVWQGAGTVNSLAGTLMNSSFWYFWWD
jgi:hypothetical protein